MNFSLNRIIAVVVAIMLLGVCFYFYIPVKDSPFSGGPVDEDNPPRKPERVSLYEYAKLNSAIMRGDIIE
jgi:hypothetical protein